MGKEQGKKPVCPGQALFAFGRTIIPPTAIADAPSIQQAYTEAVAEHSPKESEPATTLVPETTELPATSDESSAQTPTDTSATTDDFLTDAEYKALEDKHADNPKALAKALKTAFTKKTQDFAVTRKSVEAQAELIAELNNPTTRVGTLTRLAKEFGLEMASPKEVQREAEVKPVVANAIEVFKSKLKGTNLEFLADELGPALEATIRHVAEEAVGPIKATHQTMTERAAAEQRDVIFKTFETTHPDWKTHEAAMTALSSNLLPSANMDALEYMDVLYQHVTQKQQIASAVDAALAKMRQGETADPSLRTVPASSVEVVTTKNPTIREAFDAAKAEVAARTGVR